MATSNQPTKGQAWIHYVCVEDYANPGNFKTNPTIALGDWQVGLDDAAFGNFLTLPVLSPAGSRWIKLVFDASETNGQVVKIQGIDQTSPKEWSDFCVEIPTTTW